VLWPAAATTIQAAMRVWLAKRTLNDIAWQLEWDARLQRHYYWHCLQHTSVWEAPTQAMATAHAVASARMVVERAAAVVLQSLARRFQAWARVAQLRQADFNSWCGAAGLIQSAARRWCARREAVQRAWQMQWDNQTQRHFFWNKISHASLWQPPTWAMQRAHSAALVRQAGEKGAALALQCAVRSYLARRTLFSKRAQRARRQEQLATTRRNVHRVRKSAALRLQCFVRGAQARHLAQGLRTSAESAALREAEESILREARAEARRTRANLGRTSDRRRDSDLARGYAHLAAARRASTSAYAAEGQTSPPVADALPDPSPLFEQGSVLLDLDKHIELFDLALRSTAATQQPESQAPVDERKAPGLLTPKPQVPPVLSQLHVLPELPSPFEHVKAPAPGGGANLSASTHRAIGIAGAGAGAGAGASACISSSLFSPLHVAFADLAECNGAWGAEVK